MADRDDMPELDAPVMEDMEDVPPAICGIYCNGCIIAQLCSFKPLFDAAAY